MSKKVNPHTRGLTPGALGLNALCVFNHSSPHQCIGCGDSSPRLRTKHFGVGVKNGHSLIPGKDYVGVGGGTLVFDKKKEKVLLKKRGKKSRNEIGWWEKPGGIFEFGEKAADAITREVEEELGVKVKIWGFLPHTDHIIPAEKQHWVALNFLASIKSGKPKIMEPEKCEKIAWFKLDQLPENTVQPTRESVKNYLKGKFIKI